MRDFVVDYYLNFLTFLLTFLSLLYRTIKLGQMLVVWRLMVTHIANLVYMGLWVVWYFFERIIYYHLTEPLARYLYILSRGRHTVIWPAWKISYSNSKVQHLLFKKEFSDKQQFMFYEVDIFIYTHIYNNSKTSFCGPYLWEFWKWIRVIVGNSMMSTVFLDPL